MSDIFTHTPGENSKNSFQPRVAYTINNTQPVQSTYIGTEPLFYLDFENRYEDDEDMLLDAAEFGILESELDTLKSELERFDSFSMNNAETTEEKIDRFFDNASHIFDEKSVDDLGMPSIDSFLDRLRQSRLAKAYLECAEQHHVEIVFSAQVETAQYERDAAKIFLNPALDEADQMLLCARELRRHWQHRKGALIHPLTFHPDNAVLVNRAQNADLIVSVIRAAWELQLSGYKQAWEKIENSSMADLGRAFSREAYLDFRTINNGQAMAAVFEAWFLSDRCRSQDKTLINQMLSDHQGYVFELSQSESVMTPTLIAALGEMPFGKNYLAEHALTIMDDSIFTEVRDRSNANFLWFIKFERSFRETERDLQTTGGSDSPDIHAGENTAYSKGKIHGQDTANSAQIITLPFGQNSTPAEQEKKGHAPKAAKKGRRLAASGGKKSSADKEKLSNVVYLRRWSGE